MSVKQSPDFREREREVEGRDGRKEREGGMERGVGGREGKQKREKEVGEGRRERKGGRKERERNYS